MKGKLILFVLAIFLLMATALVSTAYLVKRNAKANNNGAQALEYLNQAELSSVTAQFVMGSNKSYFSYFGSDHDVQKVATGTPVQFGFFFRYEKPLDPKLVHFIASGANGEHEIPVFPKRSEGGWSWDYLAVYTPKKKGIDVINMSIDETDERATMEIDSFDRALIWRNTDLIKQNFQISEEEAFKWDWQKTKNDIAVEGYSKVDPEIPEFSSPWSIMKPGSLTFRTETARTRGNGSIQIFTLPPAKDYRDEKILPLFYEAINILYADILRGQISKEDGKTLLESPLGAGSTGLSHEKFLEGKNFTGFRFLSVGQYQSADPAQQPMYTYLGLSNDGRYFIRFEHQLFSERLRSFLKREPTCYSEECINRSFDIVTNGNDFDPDLGVLDYFVQSFEIQK